MAFAPPEFLVVGHILAPWGNKGEVKVQVITDFPDRLAPGKVVYVNGQPLKIEGSRPHKQHLLIKIETIDTVPDAEKLRHLDLTIAHSELRSLPSDEFYVFQVIGLDVLTTGGKCVGRVVDVIATGGNDVYVIEGELGEILIPAIDDVVKSIDMENCQVVIEPIEGLLPDS